MAKGSMTTGSRATRQTAKAIAGTASNRRAGRRRRCLGRRCGTNPTGAEVLRVEKIELLTGTAN
jgi:hypothetical protein